MKEDVDKVVVQLTLTICEGTVKVTFKHLKLNTWNGERNEETFERLLLQKSVCAPSTSTWGEFAYMTS